MLSCPEILAAGIAAAPGPLRAALTHAVVALALSSDPRHLRGLTLALDVLRPRPVAEPTEGHLKTFAVSIDVASTLQVRARLELARPDAPSCRRVS